MTVATRVQRLQATRDNYERITLSLTQVRSSPSQATADAAAQALVGAGLVTGTLRFKPDYSLDGESYSWAGFAQMCTKEIKDNDSRIQQAGGIYVVESRLGAW